MLSQHHTAVTTSIITMYMLQLYGSTVDTCTHAHYVVSWVVFLQNGFSSHKFSR